MKYIDKLLDKFTMYRLTLYVLIALDLAAIGLSLTGQLHYPAHSLILSSTVLVLACYVINKILAYIFDVATNIESSLITGLILALIIPPYVGGTTENFTFLLAASGLAMASKYIFNYKGSHIFNPAAIAIALTALGPKQAANWWIGTTAMLPFVVVLGMLLVRKIRRGRMLIIFFASALISSTVLAYINHISVLTDLHHTLTTSAMFFLGFIMLTEPLSSPKTDSRRDLYALVVGLLFPPQFHIGSLYSTPELALIAGNILSFVISPKSKLYLSFIQKKRISPDSLDFVFEKPAKFSYLPGQYMEWMLPHNKTDSRGNRRYFTLASSPSEDNLRVGVKFYDQGSSYKEALLAMKSDSLMIADQISGDFTLPKNKDTKLVLIAGGIGVTPYRSMIKYLSDHSQKRDIYLIYSVKTLEDIVYKEVFDEAVSEIDLKVIYSVTGQKDLKPTPNVVNGRVNTKLIERIPDFKDRTFYVSGIESMVEDITSTLKSIGISKRRIKRDYFSGYSG